MQAPIIIAIDNVERILEASKIFFPEGEIAMALNAGPPDLAEIDSFPIMKLIILQTKIPITRKSIYLMVPALVSTETFVCLKNKKMLSHNTGCIRRVKVLNLNEISSFILSLVNSNNGSIRID